MRERPEGFIPAEIGIMLERLTEGAPVVILDLEWNQGSFYTNPRIPHEIIEIGACRIDAEGQIGEKFSRTVKPQIYRQIDRHIQKVTGITQEELDRGEHFSEVWKDFIRFAENARLVTWGRDDFPVLRRNVEFVQARMPFEPPIDAQLLFGSLFLNSSTHQMNLHSALEEMKITSEIPAHRAVYDAEATALLLPRIDEKLRQLNEADLGSLKAILDREKRIALAKVMTFPTSYTSFAEAIMDRRVTHFRCPVCGSRANFAVPWFDAGKEKFEAVARCHSHGYLQGNMHLKKSAKGKVVISQRFSQANEEQVKTIKNKYRAFKMIPENKRHHRLEMRI
ncbi:MAG: exonuclease domain-containing protein [Clostridia bacterium]|nr:exonuclease domain-containing protein [Clostridia bacterium]